MADATKFKDGWSSQKRPKNVEIQPTPAFFYKDGVKIWNLKRIYLPQRQKVQAVTIQTWKDKFVLATRPHSLIFSRQTHIKLKYFNKKKNLYNKTQGKQKVPICHFDFARAVLWRTFRKWIYGSITVSQFLIVLPPPTCVCKAMNFST